MKGSFACFLLIVYGLVLGLILSPAFSATSEENALLNDFIPQFVATIAGVLAGAGLTLTIERAKTRNDEFDRRAAATNLAVHILGRMYSEQVDYKQQIIDPMRNSPVRWYHMRPGEARVLPPPQFDYQNLQFLFASSDPNIANTLALEESRFAVLVATIARRSKMHMEDVQAPLAARGIVNTIEVQRLEQELGPLVTQTMKDLTEAIVANTDAGIESTHAAMLALYETAKPLVGGRRIVRFSADHPLRG